MRNKLRPLLIVIITLFGGLLPGAAVAKVQPFPAAFTIHDMPANGAIIHTRPAGHEPVVVLLHGFGDTGDMWAPLAARLVADHTVIVPDLRGMGLSSHPETGYDKKSEAQDVAALLQALKL